MHLNTRTHFYSTISHSQNYGNICKLWNFTFFDRKSCIPDLNLCVSPRAHFFLSLPLSFSFSSYFLSPPQTTPVFTFWKSGRLRGLAWKGRRWRWRERERSFLVTFSSCRHENGTNGGKFRKRTARHKISQKQKGRNCFFFSPGPEN